MEIHMVHGDFGTEGERGSFPDCGASFPDFVIVGYPRSRTAWLAAFLSHGGVRCGHELLAEAPTIPAWLERCGRHAAGRVTGSAETAMLAQMEELLARRPRLRVVLVLRRPEEVIASLVELGFPRSRVAISWLRRGEEIAEAHPGTLAVEYEALEREETCRRILAHVAPGETFDRERWEMLRGMNVQITRERWGELAALAEKNQQR